MHTVTLNNSASSQEVVRCDFLLWSSTCFLWCRLEDFEVPISMFVELHNGRHITTPITLHTQHTSTTVQQRNID